MQYRHKVTGQVIETASELYGGPWELLQETAAAPAQDGPQKAPAKKSGAKKK